MANAGTDVKFGGKKLDLFFVRSLQAKASVCVSKLYLKINKKNITALKSQLSKTESNYETQQNVSTKLKSVRATRGAESASRDSKAPLWPQMI
jgi:hypothetical protein